MAAQSRNHSLTEPNLILVRGARQLLTLHGASGPRRGADLSALAIIPDGALLIRKGRIAEVGPTRRIERLKLAQDAVEVDATGMIVLPAFIDSATRPVFRHAANAGFEGGMRAFAESGKIVLGAVATAVLSGMVRHGTLTAEVLTGYGGNPEGEMRLMRLYASLRGRFTNLVTSFTLTGHRDAAFSGNPGEWTRQVMIPLMASASRLRRAQSATASIGEGAAGFEEAREFLWAAQSLRLKAKIQTSPECSEAAAALALVSDAHAVQGLEGPLPTVRDTLARSSAVLTLTPAITVAQGRDSFVPARALLEKGAALALATGFSRDSTGNYNMLHTMELARRYLNMTAEEAIAAATINAAHAVGCDRDCGSLEPGKRADVVLFDCAHYADLTQDAAVHQVSRVLRLGQTVYRRGRVEEPA